MTLLHSVEEMVTRFSLHNDMIFANDEIKEINLFLYALLIGFHEQEVYILVASMESIRIYY